MVGWVFPRIFPFWNDGSRGRKEEKNKPSWGISSREVPAPGHQLPAFTGAPRGLLLNSIIDSLFIPFFSSFLSFRSPSLPPTSYSTFITSSLVPPLLFFRMYSHTLEPVSLACSHWDSMYSPRGKWRARRVVEIQSDFNGSQSLFCSPSPHYTTPLRQACLLLGGLRTSKQGGTSHSRTFR